MIYELNQFCEGLMIKLTDRWLRPYTLYPPDCTVDVVGIGPPENERTIDVLLLEKLRARNEFISSCDCRLNKWPSSNILGLCFEMEIGNRFAAPLSPLHICCRQKMGRW